ncbi:hypothetical protein ACVWW4_003503 [Bradyrhizobium sp. LB7.1]
MIVRFPTSPHRDAQQSLFTSPKCRIPVPVQGVLVRHALEQSSLDATVREIQYRTVRLLECPPISLSGVVLRRQGGAFLLRVHEGRERHGGGARFRFVLERHGLRLLERAAQDIFREPLFSNVRKIWSHAGQTVSLSDRLRLSIALEEGPRRIVELENRVGLDCDVVAAVCALACENLVKVRLDQGPFGLETIVET